MDFLTDVMQFVPFHEEEACDKAVLLNALTRYDDLYTRENPILHLTASAWIVNHTRTKVLMIYHNIYDSWAWTGGHADGERDLLGVALREAREETGLRHLSPVSDRLYSAEVLTVNPHRKRGTWVTSHLHLNATYLLEADESDPLFIKADENSGVRWFSLSDAVEACSEPWMRPIYQKLNDKLALLEEK